MSILENKIKFSKLKKLPSPFFYIYQLITTYRSKKKHVPGIICFPNYAFHDYIHMFLFSKMKCFPNYIFSYDWHKNLRKSLLWILRKKNFGLCNFQSNLLCCLCNQSRWQIDFSVYLPAQARLHGSHWQAWSP